MRSNLLGSRFGVLALLAHASACGRGEPALLAGATSTGESSTSTTGTSTGGSSSDETTADGTTSTGSGEAGVGASSWHQR